MLRCCCAGGAVTDLLECEDVGVRGRVDELGMLLQSKSAPNIVQFERSKAHKESNFSISAWEYAAPTTRLDSRVGFLGLFAGGGLRQNGGAELLECQHPAARKRNRWGQTYSDLSKGRQ